MKRAIPMVVGWMVLAVAIIGCTTTPDAEIVDAGTGAEAEEIAPSRVLDVNAFDRQCETDADCVLIDLRCERCCADSAVATTAVDAIIAARAVLTCEDSGVNCECANMLAACSDEGRCFTFVCSTTCEGERP